jgi:hypothetical protein
MLPLLVVLAAAASPAPAAREAAPATVHFADGSQLTLLRWTLSYEFVTARPGEMPTASQRRNAQELRTGSRSTPVQGAQLRIEYRPQEIERVSENGEAVKERVLRPAGLTLVRAGKKSAFKLQAPDREFLAGDERKILNVLPRTLDLLGETLAGTHRELCLVSLSSLAECSPADDARVLQVDFP